MSAKVQSALRQLTPVLGLSSILAWEVAAWQALPRLTAGPLCSNAQDIAVLAGHCPACYLAVALSVAFLTSAVVHRRLKTRMLARATLST